MASKYTNVRLSKAGRIICNKSVPVYGGFLVNPGFVLAECSEGQWVPVNVPQRKERASAHMQALTEFIQAYNLYSYGMSLR